MQKLSGLASLQKQNWQRMPVNKPPVNGYSAVAPKPIGQPIYNTGQALGPGMGQKFTAPSTLPPGRGLQYPGGIQQGKDMIAGGSLASLAQKYGAAPRYLGPPAQSMPTYLRSQPKGAPVIPQAIGGEMLQTVGTTGVPLSGPAPLPPGIQPGSFAEQNWRRYGVMPR